MLLVLLAVACIVSVPLRGGSLRRLSTLRLRAEWAALGALAGQVLVLGVFAGGAAWWHAVAHVATYGLAAWFVWANRRIPGIALLALGGAMNLTAIAANDGVMPTSAGPSASPGWSPPACSPTRRRWRTRTCCGWATSCPCRCRSASATC